MQKVVVRTKRTLLKLNLQELELEVICSSHSMYSNTILALP